MKTFYGYIILFWLTLLVCINGFYAQSPVHLSNITQNLVAPVRVAIDNADTIYITDATLRQIVKYDASGNFLGTISPGGSPLSIAINDENQIFIGDGDNGNILKLNANGTTTVLYTGTLFPSSMVCISDSIYVVDSKLLHVIVLDLSGNVIRRIGSGTFTRPAGIAFNPQNNRLLVSEHGGIGGGFNPVVKVWMFGLTGNLIGSFGSHGNTNGKFYRIQGLDVDRCGNIYVPDPFQGNVSVFNSTGGFITKFGIWGDTLGALNVPLDIAINSKDSVWITSMNNGAIEVYKINYTLPTSNITTGNKTICTGDTTNIQIAFTGTSPWTFTYTNGTDTTTDSNITANPYLLPASQAGTYKVIALSDSGNIGTCFSGNPAITVDTLPPTSDITSGNATICSGETTGIIIDFTGTPPWTLTYTIDNLNPVTVNKVTNDPYILPATQAGIYEVIALSGAGCAGTVFTGAATITVNPLPASIITSGNATICTGDTTGITIDFAGTPPWSFTYTIGNINPATISNTSSDPYMLNVSKEGIYEVIALSDSNCSGTWLTGIAGITVNPLPASEITSGNKTICAGTTDITIAFTGIPPWNFTYTIDSLNPVTISNISVNPYLLPVSQAGTYQVTALSDTGCTGTNFTGTAIITLDSTIPSSTITSGNATLCSGDTTGIAIDFTGTPPWTFTYTIDGSSPEIISNVTEDPYILSASQSGIYQVSALSGGGCAGSTMTGSANISVNPSYIVDDYINICEGDTYSFGSQLLSVSGTYKKTFVSANGCDSVVILTLNVVPLPTSNITSGNRTICAGTTDIMIDFTGVPPWTLTYTIDSINPITVNSITANPYPLTVSTTGTYKVTALSDAYCTGTGFNGTAIIDIDTALPTSVITSGNAAICTGGTAGIVIDFTGTPPWNFTYTIDSLNPATISDVTATPYILTVAEGGLYEVTSLSAGNCTGTNFTGSANITVNPLPASDITNGNTTIKICSGETADLTIAFTGTPPWNFTYIIDGSNPVTVSNEPGNPYILPVSQTGTYEVTALSDAYCTGTNFTGYLDLVVNSLPASDITSGNATLCSGDTTDITIAFTGSPPWNFTYTIDDLNPTSLNNVTSNPYILPVATTGIYKVTALSDANCSGTNFTGIAGITVNPLPASDIISGNATICSGTTDITIDLTGTPPWIFTYTVDSLNPVTVSNVTIEPYILTVSQAGAYRIIAVSDSGCTGTSFTGTAVITVDSTLHASNITSGNTIICSGETTGITIDFTGTPPWTFTYTIDSINPTIISNVTATPYILTVSQAGTYRVTALSGAGCTGTSFTGTADITVIPASTGTDAATICNGANYIFGTQTLNTSGTYNEIFVAANGCDSVITLNLTVNPAISGADAATICNGANYIFGTQTLSTSGTYNETFVASNGCDSVVTLNLTVNPAITGTDAATICNGANYIFGTQTLNTSGTYNEIFVAANGCDSVATMTLTVNPAITGTDTATICNGATYIFGTQTLNTSGTYNEIFVAANGCDSVVTLILTVNPAITGTDAATICNGNNYTFGTQTLTSSGTYNETFVAANGCDSVVTLNLTVNPAITGTDAATICNGATYIFGTQTLNTSGTYNETFVAANGCDSVVTLILTVNPAITGTDAATICNGADYIFGTQTLNTSGTYNETFVASNGCDSVVTLNLTVNPAITGADAATICNGANYIFGTQTLNTSGTYNETFVASNGCDSVVTLTLTVNAAITGTDAATICNGDNYIFGTQTLSTSGTYNETFVAANGCDSVVTLTLTVTPLPIPAFTYAANGYEITFQNNSINADSFLWNFGDGDTSAFQNPVHTYQSTGDYIVTLTASNAICGGVAVSDTVTILIIEFESIGIENIIKVYPNPSSGQITIEINNSGQSDLYIEITNMVGQKIYSKLFKAQKATEQIDLSGFSSGIYTVKLITDDLVKITKLILSK